MQRKNWQTICFFVFGCVAAPNVKAEQLETFTEPYQRVAIPAPEIGVIADVSVKEGDAVSKSQVLAQLDDSVLQASLLVARAAKDALGARQTAETELELREKQVEIYRELHEQGNANQRELDRAETEYQQSASRLQSVREELEVRRLEYERVKAQLKRKVIAAPIDGYVVAIDKVVGEFVSPTDPIVMHVVHLDNLKAVFSIPYITAGELSVGQSVTLSIGYDGETCDGVIDFVSPIANAESGTTTVKIRIPNSSHQLPSGVVCRWDLETEEPVPKTARYGSHTLQR